MSTSSRNIRSLQVRAPDAAACRRVARMLEDALHTATLPGTEGSRLFVVRRLAVGAIRARQSSGQVAETIQSRFEEICSRAVYAEADGARFRIAVWFRDASEASVLLAVRLARREETDAWFWPLAVPTWNPELTRDEALRTILYRTAESQMPPGPIAAAQFVAELQARDALAPLLETLTEADGARLLHTFGWPLPSQFSGASASQTGMEKGTATEEADTYPASLPMSSVSGFNGEQAEQVQKWLNDRLYVTLLRQWGVSDSRSLWLSAMFLLAARPTRPLDSAFLADAQRIVERVHSLLTSPAVSNSGKASAPFGTVHRAQSTPDTGNSEFPPQRPFPTPGARPTDAEDTVLFPSPLAPESQRAPGGVAEASVDLGEKESTVKESTARESTTQESGAANELKSASWASLAARSDTAEAETHREGENVAPNALPGAELSPRRSFDVFADIPQPTEYAGLYFLIAALVRLGMGRLPDIHPSDIHPSAITHDFPIRLLHHIGQGMGIAAEDPILAALALSGSHTDFTADSTLSDTNVVVFAAPQAWRRELCDTRPLRHRRMVVDATADQNADDPGWNVLFDASGRLALAIWRGETPLAVTDLLGDQIPPPVQTMQAQAVETLLLDAWRESLRRWCRRYAGMGLTAITRREGRLRATRTHIDVWLDLRQADIRIRKAGLDIDPGWVPWLGRVILFHYLGGG